MFDSSQQVEMQWVARNRKRYEMLGYNFTKLFDTFLVEAKDLPKGSEKYVVVVCDYCGKPYKQLFKHQYNHKRKDCCKACWHCKMQESMMEKYGVAHALQSDEFVHRYEDTCERRFGCRKHLAATSIREKIAESYYRHGTCPTSTPQILVAAKLKGMYGACDINVPCGRALMDCVIEISGVKIDVEYDGQYWHRDTEVKDMRRNYFILNNGYKIIRIKANKNDDIPTEQQIIKAVDYLVKGNHSLTYIDMNI